MKKSLFVFTVYFLLFDPLSAQKNGFTHSDTLRGSITPERAWWDVWRYDITVKPDFDGKTIAGKTTIDFSNKKSGTETMQIDLQQPLVIDSVIFEAEKV